MLQRSGADLRRNELDKGEHYGADLRSYRIPKEPLMALLPVQNRRGYSHKQLCNLYSITMLSACLSRKSKTSRPTPQVLHADMRAWVLVLKTSFGYNSLIRHEEATESAACSKLQGGKALTENCSNARNCMHAGRVIPGGICPPPPHRSVKQGTHLQASGVSRRQCPRWLGQMSMVAWQYQLCWSDAQQ